MDLEENHPRVVLAKGGAWHEAELIRRGYTAQDLDRERKQFALVAWRDRHRGWHYPKWQFDADGQVIPEVRAIVRLFRSRDSLYVMSQFLFPNRGGKSLLDLIQAGRGTVALAAARKIVRDTEAAPKIRRKDRVELDRRFRDMRDPTRFVVVSSFLAKWALVYNPADNGYCHRYVSEACLIKDRRIAQAIARSLNDKGQPPHHHVLPVRKLRGGFRALEDLPATRHSRRWRPSFRTPKHNTTFVPITEAGTRENHVDAMVFAVRHRDEIIEAVSRSRDRITARRKLVRTFNVSEGLAETILDLRLYLMTRQSVATLTGELKEAVRSTRSGKSARRRRS